MKVKEILRELENRFGAIAEEYNISEEDEAYLETRHQIYENYCWDFNAFVKHYQLIKRYGVDEKCLETLAWKIEHMLDVSEVFQLRETKFYELFGVEVSIKNAITQRIDGEQNE